MSNWGIMPQMITEQPITSLPPSAVALSHLNMRFLLNTTTLWWCVHMITQNFSYPTVRSLQLFGWDLKSLWKSTNQKRCCALLRAGRLAEAHEAYRYMMNTTDEETKVSCRDWSIGKSLVMSLTTTLTGISLSFRARMFDALCCKWRCCSRCEGLQPGY